MLIISPAVYVKDVPSNFGKPMDYILFPDSEIKNLYYAMAERPTFSTDEDGNPRYNLTWYFGSGEEAGGICAMTVSLSLPDMDNKEVRSKITSALSNDSSTRNIAQKTFELCQAMTANQIDKVKALKLDLGFNDAIANNKHAQYDATKDYTQFLPAIDELDVRPMPYNSGTVTVQAFANNNAYQGGDPVASSGKLSTTPSLMNSNDAVVTFNLKELGANLFWHGMGGWSFKDAGVEAPPANDEVAGGSSVISVTYEVEFNGLLPAATATVTLDKSVMAKLKIEDQVKKGSWGRRYHQQVITGKEYKDAINNNTEIVVPSVVDPADKNNIRDLLTDWAAKQLEEMVASQFPDVKLDDLGNNPNGLNEINAVSTQKRTFKLTQAVSIPKYPQAQLSKISSLINPKDSKELEKYFQVINLNDKPYFDVKLTVAPPPINRLKTLKVDRFVITNLQYFDSKLRDENKNEVSTLEFDTTAKEQPISKQLIGTFSKGGKDKFLKYSYLVAYTDGTPSYHVDATQQGDQNYLDLNSLDLGVLSLEINGMDLPWDVISSVNVEVKCDKWSDTVSLNPSQKSIEVVQPFGKVIKEPTLALTFNMTSGAPFKMQNEKITNFSNGKGKVTLNSPIGDSVTEVEFELGSGVDKADLRVEYTMNVDGDDRVFKGLIRLDKSDSETTQWKVPSKTNSNSTFKVTKVQVTSDGQSSILSDLSGGLLSPLEQDTLITINKDGLTNF